MSNKIRVSEKSIEMMLVREIKKMGGLCLKLYSPWFRGMPDRMIILKGLPVRFVELKAPDTRHGLSEAQKKVHEQLRSYGVDVDLVWSKKTVKEYIEKLQNELI